MSIITNAISTSIVAPAPVQTSPAPATDKTFTTVFKNGAITVCYRNGYNYRSNDGSGWVHDIHRNNYGPSYWAREAMKELGLTPSDVALTTWGKVKLWVAF